MIHFESISVARDNTSVRIVAKKDDYTVNGVDCLANVEIDEIIITDDLHYDESFSFPSTPDVASLNAKGYYYKALDPQERIDISDSDKGLVINVNDICMQLPQFMFENRMVFVWIRTNGSVESASECAYLDVGPNNMLGVSYNMYDLYNTVINSFVSKHLKCCDMSDEFMLRMLDMKRLGLNLFGGNIRYAIESWYAIHNGCESVKTCSCNG